MVILIKIPKGLVLNRLIERRFQYLCGYKAKLKEFLPIQIFSIISGIDKNKVFLLIAKSKNMHGFILNNDELLIHPSATNFITDKMRERIKAESTNDFSKFGNTKRIAASYR